MAKERPYHLEQPKSAIMSPSFQQCGLSTKMYFSEITDLDEVDEVGMCNCCVPVDTYLMK